MQSLMRLTLQIQIYLFCNFPLSLRNTKGKASSLLIRALDLAVLLAEGLLHSSPPKVGSPAHTSSCNIRPHEALPHYHFRCSTNESPISIHVLCDDAIMQKWNIAVGPALFSKYWRIWWLKASFPTSPSVDKERPKQSRRHWKVTSLSMKTKDEWEIHYSKEFACIILLLLYY